MDQSSQNNQSNQKTPITFLPQHGHYRHLRVYQVNEMISIQPQVRKKSSPFLWFQPDSVTLYPTSKYFF